MSENLVQIGLSRKRGRVCVTEPFRATPTVSGRPVLGSRQQCRVPRLTPTLVKRSLARLCPQAPPWVTKCAASAWGKVAVQCPHKPLATHWSLTNCGDELLLWPTEYTQDALCHSGAVQHRGDRPTCADCNRRQVSSKRNRFPLAREPSQVH